jgi:hypothetical protein
MEVNNNTEINKMFGTDEEPVLAAEPELSTSPIDSPPNSSPFQEEAAEEEAVPDFGEFGSFRQDSEDGEHGEGDKSDPYKHEHGVIIGDHTGFAITGSGRGVSLKFTVVFFPIVLVLGLATGIFVCYAYFFGLYLSSNDAAARTSISAVYDYIELSYTEQELPVPAKVIFAAVYVNSKINETESVVFTVIENPSTWLSTAIFRVVKTADSTSVYKEFDPDEYDRLHAGNDTERIQAEIMLNRHFELMRALEEISDEENDVWVGVDPFNHIAHIIKTR